jgi:IS605 OrfB family transposase
MEDRLASRPLVVSKRFRASLRASIRGLFEVDRHVHLFALAHDAQDDALAHFLALHITEEIVQRPNAPPVDGGDQVWQEGTHGSPFIDSYDVSAQNNDTEGTAMQRTVKVSLKFATAKKRRRLDHLLRKYRRLTNQYIDFLWDHDGGLDAATLNAIDYFTLGYRQRSDCLKYALEIIAATVKSAQARGEQPAKPRLTHSVKFSSLTAKIEKGKGSFDYVLKISSALLRQVLVLPFKSHQRLNYWLSRPGAQMLDGCSTNGREACLWIRLPDLTSKTAGEALGIDIGYHKLITDSQGQMYGPRIKELCDKVRRKKPGSQAKLRARRERNDYIRRVVKHLPWGRLRLLAVEDLRNLKKGKRPDRGKHFRQTIAPWTYRQVIDRVEQLAPENRVHLAFVDPRNTSRECPACGTVARENRVGEKFCCVVCGYSADADYVGARNVIARTTSNSR